MTQREFPTLLDWELYRALREQWTHEDLLVNQRLIWLMLSDGLLLTAYGTISASNLRWMALGFPLFGLAVTALVGVSIYAAIAATEAIQKRYDAAGLDELCSLTPGRCFGIRGTWAARALPFVFGALWLLILAAAIATP
jgi:hypothetical protein